jgi:DNA-binding MarR family transcriptional regulator
LRNLGLEEGYVERDRSDGDRRALMIALTLKRQPLLDGIKPQDQYRLPEIMGVLREVERQKLYEFAIRVIKFLRLIVQGNL